jgi:archaellum component FlaD/FlaE
VKEQAAKILHKALKTRRTNMAKKKLDDAIEKHVEAIDFIKRLKESAPSNQIIAEVLDKVEKELNEALFQLLRQKITTGK